MFMMRGPLSNTDNRNGQLPHAGGVSRDADVRTLVIDRFHCYARQTITGGTVAIGMEKVTR